MTGRKGREVGRERESERGREGERGRERERERARGGERGGGGRRGRRQIRQTDRQERKIQAETETYKRIAMLKRYE